MVFVAHVQYILQIQQPTWISLLQRCFLIVPCLSFSIWVWDREEMIRLTTSLCAISVQQAISLADYNVSTDKSGGLRDSHNVIGSCHWSNRRHASRVPSLEDCRITERNRWGGCLQTAIEMLSKFQAFR
jgi:hypothetical protein